MSLPVSFRDSIYGDDLNKRTSLAQWKLVYLVMIPKVIPTSTITKWNQDIFCGECTCLIDFVEPYRRISCYVFPKKFVVGAATVSCLLVTALAFQNCSGHKADSGSTSAASCMATSVMANAYRSGTTFSFPQGTTADCINQSGYDTATFDAGKQQITLSGVSGNLTLPLKKGGAGCDGTAAVGQDVWEGTSGSLQTVISTNDITFQNSTGLNCQVSR